MLAFRSPTDARFARHQACAARALRVSLSSCVLVSALAGCGSSSPHASNSPGGAGNSSGGSSGDSSGGSSSVAGTMSAGAASGSANVSGSSGSSGASAGGQPSTGGWPAAELPPVGTPGVTYLSDLPWKSAVVFSDFGAPGKDSPIGKDQTVNGKTPLVINGQAYAKGLGVKTYTEITYDLGGAYKQFISDTGLDFQENSSTMIFEVKLDDQLVYDGGDATSNKDQVVPVKLDVTGKKTMLLYVRDGFDDKSGDFGIWGGARLMK